VVTSSVMKRLLFLLLILVGCHRAPDDLEPKISYTVQDRYLRQLPAPFEPLSEREWEEEWGRETRIGFAFARQLDLYQAITAFRRAIILSPPKERRLEIEYEILLCYYMGKKYDEAIYAFESSDLKQVDTRFPAFSDLLIILYECYQQTGQEQKAERILELLKLYDPDVEKRLQISKTLLQGDIASLQRSEEPYIHDFLATYRAQKKSPQKAQWLNAILPGAGYLYVGQKQSAITSFLLNGLFIAAAYHFYERGNIAAGVITTSFEAGWYFGGINGAKLEAKLYNERLYERCATPLMNQHRLFPVLMLQHAF
jgi:tetratricopeptide (TPR) repeat protein